MKTINAKIIADSVDGRGNRITSYILTYPRFIHPELMTHRVFSRNSASSRAIPFAKMLKMIQEDPFIPIAWQKDHPGMQGTEYHNEDWVKIAKIGWLTARDRAIQNAEILNNAGLTKQLCNRLLEPFMWHTVLVTATSFDNFFELRCPKYQHQNEESFKSWKDLVSAAFNQGASRDWVDGLEETPLLERLLSSKSGAEIHIQALAESMWDAINDSTPKELKAGEWHIPFGDQIDVSGTQADIFKRLDRGLTNEELDFARIKIAVARCARLSYMTFDGKIDYEKDIKLHDQLFASKHASPFEHVAKVMSSEEYNDEYFLRQPGYDELGMCNNFKGFIQYRYMIENKL